MGGLASSWPLSIEEVMEDKEKRRNRIQDKQKRKRVWEFKEKRRKKKEKKKPLWKILNEELD